MRRTLLIRDRDYSGGSYYVVVDTDIYAVQPRCIQRGSYFVLRGGRHAEFGAERGSSRAELESRATGAGETRLSVDHSAARSDARRATTGTDRDVELVRDVDRPAERYVDAIHIAIRFVMGNAGRPAIFLDAGVHAAELRFLPLVVEAFCRSVAGATP